MVERRYTQNFRAFLFGLTITIRMSSQMPSWTLYLSCSLEPYQTEFSFMQNWSVFMGKNLQCMRLSHITIVGNGPVQNYVLISKLLAKL